MTKQYYFDLWAEYLTVTLANNIARCQLTQPIKKVRITVSNDENWPLKFKVILDNGLIASFSHNPADQEGNHDIDYLFQSPCSIPLKKDSTDTASKQFMSDIQKIDSNFLPDAWALDNPTSIPSLLLNLSYRSVVKLLPLQLKKQSVDISSEFDIQFFDGSNYLSFSYDAIRHSLAEQSTLYLANDKASQLAATACFKHEHNRKWLSTIYN